MFEFHGLLRSRRAFFRGVLSGLAGIGLAYLSPQCNRCQAAPSAARPRTRIAGGPKHIADVLRFGAKGDGIADDAAAFQDAVDSLVNTGGVVGAPPGKIYALGSTITIRSKHPIWIVSRMAGRAS
jgi:polygalacturonase